MNFSKFPLRTCSLNIQGKVHGDKIWKYNVTDHLKFFKYSFQEISELANLYTRKNREIKWL